MVKLLVGFPELGLTQETRVYETDPGRFNRKEDRPQCKRHLFMAWGPQLNKKKWPNSAHHPLLLDCSIASPSALTPWPPHLPARVAWTLKQWGEVDLPYFLLLFVQLFAVAINKVIEWVHGSLRMKSSCTGRNFSTLTQWSKADWIRKSSGLMDKNALRWFSRPPTPTPQEESLFWGPVYPVGVVVNTSGGDGHHLVAFLRCSGGLERGGLGWSFDLNIPDTLGKWLPGARVKLLPEHYFKNSYSN